MKYDVIIAGLGGMGSAAFFEVTKRGYHCLGLDAHGIAHDKGSSHGETRLIRQAYFEHPDYVPLLQRSYEHWDARNLDAASPIFHRTGVVIFAPTIDTGILKDVLTSAQLHNIPVEVLDHAEQKIRYPHLVNPPDTLAVLEPGAGYLDVEKAIKLHVDLAIKNGGKYKQETITSWSADEQSCSVTTASGHRYESERLILCLGPWSPQLADLDDLLTVRRVPLFWFRPKTNAFQSGPCYAFDFGNGFFYGFREQNGLVKVAPHIPGRNSDPDSLDRHLSLAEKEQIENIVREHLPALDPEVKEHKVCMYTMTADEHFLIDHHPLSKNVVLAAGMSGHGFKFAPVVGEILADLTVNGSTNQPCGFLRIQRPKGPA